MPTSLSALAGVEIRRLLLHPLLLAGTALSVLVVWAGADQSGQMQSFLLMGLAVLPLALGTFAATNLAALRSRRGGADELLDTLPQGASLRTGAQLLAVLAPVPLAIALLAAAHLWFGAADGLVIAADGERRVPALVELAQGPLVVLALGAVGVLLGRVGPLTPLGLLLIVVIVFAEVPLAAWTPDSAWRWAVPLANDIVAVPDAWGPCEPGVRAECGTVERFDTTGMAWHLLGLAAVTAVASAAALAAGRRK